MCSKSFICRLAVCADGIRSPLKRSLGGDNTDCTHKNKRKEDTNMKKNAKRLLSLLLALSMVFGQLVFPVSAAETDDHDHAAAAITPSMEEIQVSLEDAFQAIPLKSEGVEPDMESPIIQGVEAELKDMMVLNAEGDPVPLTQEQIMQVLYLFQQYLDVWQSNAHVMGVQVPFFLQYNDNGEDGLGILGEMLALANIPLEYVRGGYVSFTDLTGMIETFTYAVALGVEFYGDEVVAGRNEVMDAIEASGAKTEAQKLLVINDWLAHNVTFDMPYIMNKGKDEDKKPMVAEKAKNPEHYDAVYNRIESDYLKNLPEQFKQQIRDGLEADMKVQYYLMAIESVMKDMLAAQLVSQEAQKEPYVTNAKETYAEGVYEEELAKLEGSEFYQEAYDAAFNKYLDDNCQHEFKAVFTWTEASEGQWTATADVTCGVCGREHKGLEATTVNKEVEANCTEPKRTVCEASVTVAGQTFTEQKTLVASVGDPLGHDLVDVDGKDVTCEEDGLKPGKKCTRCDYIEQEVIPATGHTEEAIPEVEATCTTEGSTGGKKCSVCLEILEAATVVPMIAHTGGTASCTKKAVCTVCTQEYGELAEHAYAEAWTMDAEKHWHACANCDTRDAEAVHTPNIDAATEDTAKFCTVCNYVMEAATVHVHSVTVVEEQAATCTEAGNTVYYTCSCGKLFTDAEATTETNDKEVTIPAKGHTLDEGVETTAPTCTEAGVMTFTCTVCGETKTEEIAAKGHIDKNPADTNCDVCDEYVPYNPDNAEVKVENDTVAAEGEEEPKEEESTIRKAAAAAAEKEAQGAIEVEAEKRAQEAADNATAEELQQYAEQLVRADAAKMETINATAAEQAAGYVTANEAEIKADPVAFVNGESESKETIFLTEVPVTDADGNYIIGEDGAPVMMTIAAQLHAGYDQFWADAQENGVAMDQSKPDEKTSIEEIVNIYMDQPMEDLGGATPNQAIPGYAAQAAAGLTGGVFDFWQGSQFGAFGSGSAVCLGYTMAFTYLVQYMHPEVYGVNGARTDMDNGANWKKPEDLYYNANGELDLNSGYLVDDVRITFDASVTMYGVTQENFNSDHFWNAVKVDGKWYYCDPCYTDVFTEVMMRDRVETDGSMNHLYFMFSDTSARQMYDGYFKEGGIATRYEAAATNTDYEDSWMSRIKSNTYFNGKTAYYIYDSTDLISLMAEVDNNSGNTDFSDMEDKEIKLVAHSLTNSDSGNTAEDFTTLIAFNDMDAEESVAMVRNASGSMVESELLTKLYAQHEADAEIYPSLAITTGLYNNKLYFNLSNVVLAYDLDTCEVSIVKEYNSVNGSRDKTNAFGGMAFTVASSGLPADNHPIAALTVKDDGNLYVSIATNYAFISGKDPHNSEDQSSYGYEFEESNYNPAYSTYTQDQFGDMADQYDYEEEINDNDEFMWTANFVEKLNLACRHSYSEVTIPAYCGRNAYTENRCSSCGASEAGSRVEVENSALSAHHYVMFNESYYTKDDNGNWNKGVSYICTVCGFHIEEPTEPSQNQYQDYEEEMEKYEKELEIYNNAVETAGHTYAPTDAVWAADYSSVSFSALECSSVCPERNDYLDCLLEDDTITVKLPNKITTSDITATFDGICPEGVVITYTATGTSTYNSKEITYTATTQVEKEPAECTMVDGVCSVCGYFEVSRVAGDIRYETAINSANLLKEVYGVEKFENIILACGGFGGEEDTGFADALTGSFLASQKEAPVLMHYGDKSVEVNFAYIEENLAEGGTIYMLGGPVSIPEEVEADLKEASYNVMRLAGDTRYLTNLEILESAGVGDKEILITSGWGFADSLSVGATGMPILLVNSITGNLIPEQIAFLEEYKDNTFTVIGGEAAISEELKAKLEEVLGKELERVYGETREETSVAIAEKYFSAPEFAVIAYSRLFPDGLCGGPLACALKAPLLLTNVNEAQVAITNAYLEEMDITSGYVMGGVNVLDDDVVKAVFGLTSVREVPIA